eukprot:12933800-Prorocentrum_lima.AAC.1
MFFGGLPIKRFTVPVGFMNQSCVNTRTMRNTSAEVRMTRLYHTVTVDYQNPVVVRTGHKGGAR